MTGMVTVSGRQSYTLILMINTCAERCTMEKSKYPAIGLSDKMPFGKYKGTEVEEILQDDSRYLVWLLESTDTNFTQEVIDLIEQV